MHDHNLDDLIIGEVETKKNEKTKGILTILALVIVVLIIAIVLTKIILKEPKVDTIVHDNTTHMIDPELTLQEENDTQEKTKTVSEVITHKNDIDNLDNESDDNNEVKPVKHITQTKKEDIHTVKIPKPIAKHKVIKPKVPHETKHKKVVKKVEKVVINDEFEQVKKTTHTNIKTVEKYYIQVGSFSQQPNGEFLNVIKKSGFNYTVLSLPNGMKKLLIGPYPSRQSVDKALPKVRDRISKGAFVYKVK